jgi:hypothetical protein
MVSFLYYRRVLVPGLGFMTTAIWAAAELAICYLELVLMLFFVCGDDQFGSTCVVA